MTHANLRLCIFHRITVVDGDHGEFSLSLLKGGIVEAPDRLLAVLLSVRLAYEGLLLLLNLFDVDLASGTCVVTGHLQALTLRDASHVRDSSVIGARWITLGHLHV